MSATKKSVKRRPRVIAARDLMSVTGGVNFGGNKFDPTTVGMAPQGPRNPWGPRGPIGYHPQGPGGPTLGINPQGPRDPLGLGAGRKE
jgi:hypothetical protein